MKSLLLKHLSGESIGRFPVWMMRQAGRYLPGYQAIRKENTFWEMVTTPDLAAKVSLLPLDVLPVDAVIFFSDILTLPYGLGIPVEMRESVGPVVTNPLRNENDFEVFRSFNADSHVGYVGEALRKIRSQLKEEVALLGFAGAPWTVCSYLIEGGSSRHFFAVKEWATRDPKQFVSSLGLVADATVDYLKFQHRAGAEMVQLFDTWLSEMPVEFFRNHYLGLLNGIFDRLRDAKIPSIFFCKNAHHLDGELSKVRADVMSCDSLLPLSEMDKRFYGSFSLQGNLDPVVLRVADAPTVRRMTRNLVMEARELRKPAILNLGHGILPGTPVENAKAFVEESIALWI